MHSGKKKKTWRRSCHSVPEKHSSTIKRLHTCCTVRSMCEHALIRICTAQSNRRLQLLPCHNLCRCKVKGCLCRTLVLPCPAAPVHAWTLSPAAEGTFSLRSPDDARSRLSQKKHSHTGSRMFLHVYRRQTGPTPGPELGAGRFSILFLFDPKRLWTYVSNEREVEWE